MKGRKVAGTNKFIDLFLVYQFVKRIITPFDKWPAYELGIIDEKGKVLIRKSALDTEASKAWGYFDIMCANLKKILGKLPGGQTRLASIAASAFLFKEHKEKDYTDAKVLEEDFLAFQMQFLANQRCLGALAGCAGNGFELGAGHTPS